MKTKIVTFISLALVFLNLSFTLAQDIDTTIVDCTWTDLKFPPGDAFSLYYDSEFDVIYAGAFGGICKFSPSTNAWSSMNTDTSASIWPNVKVISMCIDKKGVFYAGADANTLSFVSYDRRGKWQIITQPIVNVISLFAHDDGTVYFGTAAGLYKTTDSAKTFTKLPTPFTYVSVITADKNGNLFAGSGGVFRSKDQGTTWQQLPLRVQGEMIISIAVNSKNTIFVASYSDFSKSTDGGDTWSSLDSKLPTHIPWLYKYVAVDNNDNIFLNCYGILYSRDTGESWKKIFLPTSKILSLNPRQIVTDIRNNIYISSKYDTFGSKAGVFMGELIKTGVISESDFLITQEFTLLQNYPNPFNPSTKIRYSIPTVGRDLISTNKVVLKVYDVLGREVATLVNEEKQPGTYEVKFDGTNLPSGIYFYRLQAGSFLQTKKLMLMK